MALDKKAYEALESIVGSENITEDPAILLGYQYNSQIPLMLALSDYDSAKITPYPPEAVILPGSTDEVASIVKTCNRHRVKFKAFGTGWIAVAMPLQPGVITLDLRRMNRIIEIDRKNMYAVVEPYVIAGVLEAEVEKVGLTAHVIGASASTSIVASTTSFSGHGMKGTLTSHNNRNLLGAEWVLPTGDVLRVGSMGSGAGWFTGDGPGFSLRGVLRGSMGMAGGNGVFTKCAVKLYPWPGPAEREFVGEHPQVGLKLPDNFKFYFAYWSDWNHQADAVYKICESEIGMSVWRTEPSLFTTYLTETNNEGAKILGEFIDKYRFALEVFLAGNSMGEIRYQEKVLKDIVAETGGKFVPLDEEPFKGQIAVLNHEYVSSGRMGRIFRPTGDFASSYLSAESWDMSIKAVKAGEQCIKEFQDKGDLLQEIEGFWGGPYERNKYSTFEGVYSLDPTDPNSRKAANAYTHKMIRDSVEKRFQILPVSPEINKLAGPAMGNYHELWLKKLTKAIDPNDSADRGNFG